MITSRNNLWLIVVAGAMGTAVGAGIFMVYAFGILAKALSAEYHWDRSVVQYCLTSFLVATGFGTVLLGNVMNRWGVRRPAMASITVFATAIAALAILPASTFLFYAVFALIGVSSAAATAMPYAVSVAGWFDRNRGLALGLVNTGAGVGAALAPQYANFLVTTYGWRVGFLGIALVSGLVPLVGLAFLVREPPAAASATNTASAPLRHAYLHNRHFWLIAIGILGVSVALFGVMGSMVPMLTDRGVSGGTVAAALSVAGASSWVGRIAVGFAMDKVFAPYVATFSFALALVGVGLVAFTQATPPLILGAALIGITFGAEGDLVTYLASRYFGMGIYSRVLGALWVTWAWGGGIGTYLVGVSFSATRSYEFALTIFAAVLIASSIAVLMLGPYVNPPERSRGATNAILAA